MGLLRVPDHGVVVKRTPFTLAAGSLVGVV
jgi:hypothetical protein